MSKDEITENIIGKLVSFGGRHKHYGVLTAIDKNHPSVISGEFNSYQIDNVYWVSKITVLTQSDVIPLIYRSGE